MAKEGPYPTELAARKAVPDFKILSQTATGWLAFLNGSDAIGHPSTAGTLRT